MPVPEHLRGPFVQVAQRLRWTKDAPPRHDRVSERPRNRHTGEYLDGDAPTLVTFDADDAIDVESLLRAGALRPHIPVAILDEPSADEHANLVEFPRAAKKGGK